MSDFRTKVIETFKQNDIRQGRAPSEYEKFTYYDWWLYMEGTGVIPSVDDDMANDFSWDCMDCDCTKEEWM